MEDREAGNNIALTLIRKETDKFLTLTIAIDKLDKTGMDTVKEELAGGGLAKDAIQKLAEILDFRGNTSEKLAFLDRKFSSAETGRKGLEEMREVCQFALCHSKAWNAGAARFWGPATSLGWETPVGRAQGFLLAPPEVEPGRRYPLVVVVHGGPAGTHTAGWPARWPAVLPSQGFYVLLPNPRKFGRLPNSPYLAARSQVILGRMNAADIP